jgi:hypothetical protein
MLAVYTDKGFPVDWLLHVKFYFAPHILHVPCNCCRLGGGALFAFSQFLNLGIDGLKFHTRL